MIHDELRKFSIENKKFYYDLHGKNSNDSLNKQNEKFELICLLFGIDDFKTYQLYSKNYLIELVKDYRNNKLIKIPYCLPINKKPPYRSSICESTGKYILKK